MSKLLFSRLFLIESLPQPLSLASRHLQILDRYITGTKLCLRQMRDPTTGEGTKAIQKSMAGTERVLAEIHLDDREYELFEPFAGTEVRKNRYFHEYDQQPFAFNIYLGPLKGLMLAHAEFDEREHAADFDPPPFAVRELTGESFFLDDNLSRCNFENVLMELRRPGQIG